MLLLRVRSCKRGREEARTSTGSFSENRLIIKRRIAKGGHLGGKSLWPRFLSALHLTLVGVKLVLSLFQRDFRVLSGILPVLSRGQKCDPVEYTITF